MRPARETMQGRSLVPAASFDTNPAIRHRHKAHRNLRQRFFRCPGRFLHQRILPLISVCQADGRAQFVLRDVLEAHQMLAGLGRVARLLVGARQAEFGGSVQRIQLERVLESINRLRILLQLRRLQRPESTSCRHHSDQSR